MKYCDHENLYAYGMYIYVQTYETGLTTGTPNWLNVHLKRLLCEVPLCSIVPINWERHFHGYPLCVCKYAWRSPMKKYNVATRLFRWHSECVLPVITEPSDRSNI